MSVGIVIEGHLIPEISKAISSEDGELFQLITWIASNCGFAWNKYIDAHWDTKCGHRDESFKNWLATQIQLKNVHEIPPKPFNEEHLKKIAKYGLPPDSFNKHYLECANGTDRPRFIIADEIDFHDPKEKSSPLKIKEKIRKDESGRVARFLKKEVGITVRCKNNTYEYFCKNKTCSAKCTEDCPCL